MTIWFMWALFWTGFGWFLKDIYKEIQKYKRGRDRWKPEYRRAADILRELNIK
jgi:hypothetical protein